MTALVVDAVGVLHPAQSAALASLAGSFRLAGAGEPSRVAALSGTAGWPTRATDAVVRGADCVLIHAPSLPNPSDVAKLARTARERGAGVVLAEPYAGDPGLESAVPRRTDRLDECSALLLHDVRPSETPFEVVFESLRLLRRWGHTDVTFDRIRVTIRGAATTGRTSGGGLVIIESTVSSAEPRHLVVEAHGARSFASVALFGEEPVRPARTLLADGAGLRCNPAVYETATRFAWRRVLDLMSGERSASIGDLDHMLEDAVQTHALAANLASQEREPR